MRRSRSKRGARPRTAPSAAPSPGARRRFDALLGAILLGALLLRLWGIADRLPSPQVADLPMDDTAVDEGDRRAMQYAWEMWWGGVRAPDLNPATGDWPGLPFYLTLASQVAYRGWDLLKHPGSSPISFRDRAIARPEGIFLAARLPSVALGVASVWLLYLLGAAVIDRRAGLVAAAILATMPFHVFSSQRIADPNLLSLAFMTAATLYMVRLVRSRATRDSLLAGVFVGLAGASKYLPYVLVVPLALAHLERVTPIVAAGRARFAVRWRALLAALGSSLLAFALASPYTFLDLARKWRDMQLQQERLTAAWAGLSTHGHALPVYLTRTLPDLLSWPGYALALVGCVLLSRRGREGRLLLAGSFLFLLAVGNLSLAQPRFAFPAVGGLVVAAAATATWLGDRSGARFGARSAGLVPALVAAGLVAWGLAETASMRSQLARPDTRHLAHEWIGRSIDPNVILAADPYGPIFRRGPDGRRALGWPFYTSHTDFVKGAFHAEWLDGIRYYVTSSEVTRRFEGSDPAYEPERRFYAWIRTRGTKVWSSDPRSAFGPQLDVYRIPDSVSTRAERDSVWEMERRTRPQGGRIARWTADLAQDFLLSADPRRAAEWARRGLSLNARESRQSLLETLSFAEYQLGNYAEAEAEARSGVELYPNAALLHVFRAMALEKLGRNAEALEDYRTALPLSEKEAAKEFVAGAIRRLESEGTAGRGNALER